MDWIDIQYEEEYAYEETFNKPEYYEEEEKKSEDKRN